MTKDVSTLIQETLLLDVRDVERNLQRWLADAETHVDAKWADVDGAADLLEVVDGHLHEVTSVCKRMLKRLDGLPAE